MNKSQFYSRVADHLDLPVTQVGKVVKGAADVLASLDDKERAATLKALGIALAPAPKPKAKAS